MRREISTIVYKNHPKFNSREEAIEFIKNEISKEQIDKAIEINLNRYSMEKAKVTVIYNWRTRELTYIYHWDEGIELGEYDIVIEKR